jgi:uncharacterized membrane protein
MPIDPKLQSLISKRNSLSRFPEIDKTDLEAEIVELRIRTLVEAKIAEFPALLADPARRERLAALLSDGQAAGHE